MMYIHLAFIEANKNKKHVIMYSAEQYGNRKINKK